MPPRAAARAGYGRTLLDVAASAARAPAAIRDGQVDGVNAAALHVTNAIRDEIRRASGGDMRLSGFGGKGRKVGARYKMYGGTVNPQAWIKASGPVPIIEFGVGPHEITPRSGRRSAKGRRYRGGKKALRFNGRFASRVMHPGSPAKRPFKKGWEKSKGDTPRIFREKIRVALIDEWF